MNPHWRPWKVIHGKITGVTSVGDSQNFSFQVFYANVCPKCHSAVAKYKIAIKNNLFYFATLIFLGYNTSICSNCELSISLLFKEYFCDTKKDYFWVASSIFFQNIDRHEIFDIKKITIIIFQWDSFFYMKDFALAWPHLKTWCISMKHA